MIEVRRADDDELCGHIDERDGQWVALTVFGAPLGTHGDRNAAERQVLDEGLASLAERWTLSEGPDGEDEIVCILEANPTSVTLARDYYPGPGVPTITLTPEDLATGTWHLSR